MHIPGVLGMPRRIYTYEPGRGWDTLNFLVSIGAFVQGIATLVFVAKPGCLLLQRSQKRGTIRGTPGLLNGLQVRRPLFYNFASVPNRR